MMKNFRMPLVGKALSGAVLMIAFLVAPSLIANSNSASSHSDYNYNIAAPAAAVATRETNEAAAVEAEAGMLYEEMSLEDKGLTREAFTNAFKGYKNLLERGVVKKTNVISVADFSQSSRKKRLFVLDMDQHEVIMQTYVAHGRGSGDEYARSFSNTPETHKSSLGFYLTKGTYTGQHGLSLVLDGLEKGFNNNAEARRIVVHGANYIGDRHLQANPFTGRSHGCPAVASNLSKKLIQTIKDGSVLFIYHPTQSYLKGSRILNG